MTLLMIVMASMASTSPFEMFVGQRRLACKGAGRGQVREIRKIAATSGASAADCRSLGLFRGRPESVATHLESLVDAPAAIVTLRGLDARRWPVFSAATASSSPLSHSSRTHTELE